MPINPIKEQRKKSKKYIIGFYSNNKEFETTLNNVLNSIGINYELINLSNLDFDAIKLYSSILDEAILDNSAPKDIINMLNELNIYSRISNIEGINNLSGIILDRSKLVLEFKKEKTYEFEKDLKFIMQIVSILENKDPYTKDHSARVAKYALAIGEDFFSEKYDELYGSSKEQNPEQYEEFKHNYIIQQMNLTMLSAWAHDIGKNSIAQNLLDKDSKLTEDEYSIMKMHADFGANIIRKILGNEEFAEIVENHHERIDGNGYHNLTEFSDISKIIAIADAFDAMTTTRSYTTKLEQNNEKSRLLTVAEAINELQVSSHLHFDINENRMSQQFDTKLTDILVKKLKKELLLLHEGKIEEVTLLSSGIDENGYLKAGFWDDKTQEYSHDKSVSNSFPNVLK